MKQIFLKKSVKSWHLEFSFDFVENTLNGIAHPFMWTGKYGTALVNQLNSDLPGIEAFGSLY